MRVSKTSLAFLVLLPIVLLSGTSSGEFGDEPAGLGPGKGMGMGVVSAGVRETSCRVAPPPPPLSLPWACLALGGSSRLLAGSPCQNRGDLGEAVMPGIWEVTMGEEGAGTRQEIGLKPSKDSDRPWEVGAPGPGGLGPVGNPAEKRPRPAPKSTPSRPDLCNRDPSGPYISRPLKDQRSFPAVSYKRGADP